MPFRKLGLIEPLAQAVAAQGYTLPTPIQNQTIPHVLAGKDLFGCAQTGTGKTAAFALPILQRLHLQSVQAAKAAKATAQQPAAAAAPQPNHALPPYATRQPAPAGPRNAHKPQPHARPAESAAARPIRALVLTPTRELAAQISDNFRAYGRNTSLRHTVIFGGVSQRPQCQALHRGVDILVATPGRLLDLLNQKQLTLAGVQILVLDEADRMLDMGFIHDIRRVIALLPAQRQTLLFSATMPREIRTLADSLLHNPLEIKIESQSAAADTVEQSLYFVEPASKAHLLEHLLKDPAITRALVFTRTKRGADRVTDRLNHNDIPAEAIHSNKSQNARLRALDNFKKGRTRVLVASDIAARGLDVDNITHVFNYDLPGDPETYVHRIGRTGRAGATGVAISFCSNEQRDELRGIEKLLGRPIPVLKHSIKPTPAAAQAHKPQPHGQPQQHAGHKHANQSGQHPQGKQNQPHRDGAPQEALDADASQDTRYAHPRPARPKRRTPSPEKQQAEFWKHRRKPSPFNRHNRRGGKGGPAGRGNHRGR